MIQPKIDSLHEPACDVAVVVLHEHDPILQPGFAAKFVNFLDQRFASLIAWVGFTCENELHRARGVTHQSFQSFLIAEQQRASLISGKASRKTDCQDFRVQNTIDVADGFGRLAQSLAALLLPLTNKVDQAALKLLMGLPKLRIWNVNNATPELRLGEVLLPI